MANLRTRDQLDLLERRRTSFNDIADLYDRARPSLPTRVVDQLISAATLSRGSRILEIGCGTGKLTVPLALTGCPVLALEPAPRMAAIAKHNCLRLGDVRVVEERFEAWNPGDATFHFVVSAQAFHWVPLSNGMAKVASLTRASGVIAFVSTVDVSQRTAFWQDSQELYRRYLAIEPVLPRNTFREAIARTRQFGAVREITHEWSKTYSIDRYLMLLNTFSDHRVMPDDRRVSFMKEMERLIRKHANVVTRYYRTTVLVAVKHV